MTTHRHHLIHENTRAAWESLDLSKRERVVLDAIKRAAVPVTDREVLALMGGSDLNQARPSLTRMVQAGVLREVDSVKCPVTGRMVRRVWPAEKQLPLFREAV